MTDILTDFTDAGESQFRIAINDEVMGGICADSQPSIRPHLRRQLNRFLPELPPAHPSNRAPALQTRDFDK